MNEKENESFGNYSRNKYVRDVKIISMVHLMFQPYRTEECAQQMYRATWKTGENLGEKENVTLPIYKGRTGQNFGENTLPCWINNTT